MPPRIRCALRPHAPLVRDNFATRETEVHGASSELHTNKRENSTTILARRLQCNAACGIFLTGWMEIGIE
jgi:hypothetical protein